MLLASRAEAARATDIPCPDPFTDPKNDFCNPLRYIPTTALTAVSFSALYAVALSICHSLELRPHPRRRYYSDAVDMEIWGKVDDGNDYRLLQCVDVHLFH